MIDAKSMNKLAYESLITAEQFGTLLSKIESEAKKGKFNLIMHFSSYEAASLYSQKLMELGFICEVANDISAKDSSQRYMINIC